MASQRVPKLLLSQYTSMYILILVVYLSVFGLVATSQTTVSSSIPNIHSLLPVNNPLPPPCISIKCKNLLARRRLKRADPAATALPPARHQPLNLAQPPAPPSTPQKVHPNPTPPKPVSAMANGVASTSSPKGSVTQDGTQTTSSRGTADDKKVTKSSSKAEQPLTAVAAAAAAADQALNATTITANTTITDSEAGISSIQEETSAAEPKFIIIVFAAAIGGIAVCSCCILGVIRLMRRYYSSPATSAPTCSYSENAANAAMPAGKPGKNRLRITSLKNIGAPMATVPTSSSAPLLTEFWDIPSGDSSKASKARSIRSTRSSKKVAPELGPLPKSMSILRDKHQSGRTRSLWAFSYISKTSMCTDRGDAPPVPPLPPAMVPEVPVTTAATPLSQQPQAKQKLRVDVASPYQYASIEHHDGVTSPTSPALSQASTSCSVSSHTKSKRMPGNIPAPLAKISTANLRPGINGPPSASPPPTSSSTCVYSLHRFSPSGSRFPSPEESEMAKASWLSDDENNTDGLPNRRNVPLYEPLPHDVSLTGPWSPDDGHRHHENQPSHNPVNHPYHHQNYRDHHHQQQQSHQYQYPQQQSWVDTQIHPQVHIVK